MGVFNRSMQDDRRAETMENVLIIALIAITALVVIGTVGARAIALRQTISRAR